MSVIIREAHKTPEDVAAMVAMSYALHDHHAACDARSQHVRDDEAARKEIIEMLDSDDTRAWLAFDGDDVVGMGIGKIRDREGHVPPVAGYIRKMIVLESHRGRGIARRLLDEVLAFFTEREIDMVDLHYLVNNESAERFWTGLGFEPFLMNARTTLNDLRGRLSR